MNPKTYLLCGIMLFVLSCGKKNDPEIQRAERIIDTLYIDAAALYDSYPDSAMKIGRESLRLARQIKKLEKEVKGLTNIAYAHYIKGNYPEALDTFQQALDIDNEKKLHISKAGHYNNIGNIYKSMEIFDTAITRYNMAYCIAMQNCNNERPGKKWNSNEAKSFDTVLCNAMMNLGYVYERKANDYRGSTKDFSAFLDTAFSFERQALSISESLPHRKNLNIIYNNLGKMHRLSGNSDSAFYYFYRAIDLSDSVKDRRGKGESHIFLAELYDSLHSYDSAIVNGSKALMEVSGSSYTRGKLMAYSVLASAFESAEMKDSALYYYKKKDSVYQLLYSISKVQQVQFSDIEHRNMEVRREKEKADKLKNAIHYANLFGLAFLLLLIGMRLFIKIVLRKNRQRRLEIIGSAFILVLFEFINLLIHPSIEHWLDESPYKIFNWFPVVWFFLIVCAMAIFLMSPLHHRVDHWLKSKFVEDQK